MISIIKRVIVAVAIILSAMLFAIGIIAVIMASNFDQDIVTIGNYDQEHLPIYRIMVIIDGTNEAYVEALNKGLSNAAKEYNVAFELRLIEGEEKDEALLKQFDIAIESKVDGIILQPFPDVDFDHLFLKAKGNGIPVLTIITDAPKEEKISSIIYNRYKIGSDLGHIMNEELVYRDKKEGTIIMVYNDQLSLNDEALGIDEELLGDFKIEFVKVNYSGENILNAEELTKEIIDEYEDIAVIISTSEQETLGIVQGLKEENKINDVLIIGFDYSEEMQDYINRGIVFATVVPNNEQLGYEAMENMVEYKMGNFVSMYQGISVRIITAENIEQYRDELGGAKNE